MPRQKLQDAGEIFDLVRGIDEGELVNRLNDELTRVVRAVYETDLKGSLTLKLDFVPDAESGRVEIRPDVKAKVPIAPVASTTYFAHPDGRLRKEDPRQGKMDFNREPGIGTDGRRAGEVRRSARRARYMGTVRAFREKTSGYRERAETVEKRYEDERAKHSKARRLNIFGPTSKS